MTKTNSPLVTIFTPIFNTGRYVLKTLQSIKSQTYTNIEHILIDDASTDNSFEIVKKWIKENNYNCNLIKNDTNKGLVWNVNYALNLSKGYYFYCIGDDIIDSNFIDTYVNEFKNCEKDIALLFSNYYEIDKNDNIIKKPSTKVKLNEFNKISAYEQFKTLLSGNFICAPTIFTIKDLIVSIGGYDVNYSAEDIQLTLNLTKNGYKLKHLEDITLTYYRIRSNSITGLSKSRGSVAPLKFYFQYLNIEKEINDILAPRYYYWTKRLLMYERYKDLNWPWLTFKLNKDFKSFLLIVQAIYNKVKY